MQQQVLSFEAMKGPPLSISSLFSSSSAWTSAVASQPFYHSPLWSPQTLLHTGVTGIFVNGKVSSLHSLAGKPSTASQYAFKVSTLANLSCLPWPSSGARKTGYFVFLKHIRLWLTQGCCICYSRCLNALSLNLLAYLTFTSFRSLLQCPPQRGLHWESPMRAAPLLQPLSITWPYVTVFPCVLFSETIWELLPHSWPLPRKREIHNTAHPHRNKHGNHPSPPRPTGSQDTKMATAG